MMRLLIALGIVLILVGIIIFVIIRDKKKQKELKKVNFNGNKRGLLGAAGAGLGGGLYGLLAHKHAPTNSKGWIEKATEELDDDSDDDAENSDDDENLNK